MLTEEEAPVKGGERMQVPTLPLDKLQESIPEFGSSHINAPESQGGPRHQKVSQACKPSTAPLPPGPGGNSRHRRLTFSKTLPDGVQTYRDPGRENSSPEDHFPPHPGGRARPHTQGGSVTARLPHIPAMDPAPPPGADMRQALVSREQQRILRPNSKPQTESRPRSRWNGQPGRAASMPILGHFDTGSRIQTPMLKSVMTPKLASAQMEVSDLALSVDIGLSEEDMKYHNIDQAAAARIGRVINVYSVGFYQTVAEICAHGRDKTSLLAKIGRTFLNYWSTNLGVTFSSTLLNAFDERDALKAEMVDKRHQTESLEEGLKKMVHLSLERMLHERVGLQEKDLLRTQLEAEREAHRTTQMQLEGYLREREQQELALSDRDVLAITARQEMQKQQAECTRLTEVVVDLRAEVKREKAESAALKVQLEKLGGSMQALTSEVGFKEGQNQQLLENAQVMVQNAEQAVLKRDEELEYYKAANKELAWSKALLTGHMERYKDQINHHQSQIDRIKDLEDTVQELKLQVSAEEKKGKRFEQEAKAREKDLSEALSSSHEKKMKWKQMAQEGSKSLVDQTQNHAKELEEARQDHEKEIKRLHEQIEESTRKHDAYVKSQAEEMKKLVEYTSVTSAAAIEGRDEEAMRRINELSDIRKQHQKEMKEVMDKSVQDRKRLDAAHTKVVEENAELYRRLSKAEAISKEASEKMDHYKSEAVNKSDLVTPLRDQLSQAHIKLEASKRSLEALQKEHVKVREELVLVHQQEAKAKAQVERLIYLETTLPSVEEKLQESLVQGVEKAQQLKALEVDLATARAAEDKLLKEIAKQEQLWRSKLEASEGVGQQQNRGMQTLRQELQEVHQDRAAVSRQLEELRVTAGKEAAASKQEADIQVAKLGRAQDQVAELREQVKGLKEEAAASEGKATEALQRVRAELQEAHQAVQQKAQENIQLISDMQLIKEHLSTMTENNERERSIILRQQKHLAVCDVSISEEAVTHCTDLVPMHPHLQVDRSKTLLAATFQAACIHSVGLPHLADANPQPHPQPESNTPTAIFVELLKVLEESCYLRTLAGVGPVMTTMEGQLREKVQDLLAQLEGMLLEKIAQAQAPLMPKMDAALTRLKKFSKILITKIAHYRRHNVVLRFKHATAVSQLNFASGQLNHVRGVLREEQDRNKEVNAKWTATDEKLRMMERSSRDETESLMRGIKEAQQEAADLRVQLQTATHHLQVAQANLNVQSRKDQQVIEKLRDINGRRIGALGDMMQEIVQMKNDARNYADECLMLYKERLKNDSEVVFAKVKDAETVVNQRNKTIMEGRKQHEDMRLELERQQQATSVMAHALEMERAGSARALVEQAWLGETHVAGGTRKKRPTLQVLEGPPDQMQFTLDTLNKIIGQIYAEKILADVESTEKGASIRDLRTFVYTYFMNKFQVQQVAELALFGLLKGLDQHSHASKRVQMFSRFIGYDTTSYMPTQDASFFLTVLSCILENTPPGELGKPATPPPAKPLEEGELDGTGSEGTASRSVTPVQSAMVDQRAIMNGGSVFSMEVALTVANTVTAGCTNEMRKAVMQEVVNLEEVSGNINLDMFLEIMMGFYLREKAAATMVTRAMFLQASKLKQSTLTLDEFTTFIQQKKADLPEKAAVDFYVSVGEVMNFEAFSIVMWKTKLAEFAFANLSVFDYYKIPSNASLEQESAEKGQYAKFHEYDERGLLEESWEVVRDLIMYETRVVRTKPGMEDSTSEVTEMVSNLDAMIRKIRVGENLLSKSWKLYRLLVPVGIFLTRKRELLSAQSEVAYLLGDDVVV